MGAARIVEYTVQHVVSILHPGGKGVEELSSPVAQAPMISRRRAEWKKRCGMVWLGTGRSRTYPSGPGELPRHENQELARFMK